MSLYVRSRTRDRLDPCRSSHTNASATTVSHNKHNPTCHHVCPRNAIARLGNAMVGAARPTISKARVWWRKNVAGQGAVGQGPRTPWRATTPSQGEHTPRAQSRLCDHRAHQRREGGIGVQGNIALARPRQRLGARPRTNKYRRRIGMYVHNKTLVVILAAHADSVPATVGHGNAVAWFERQCVGRGR
jgi:hypothetical protein